MWNWFRKKSPAEILSKMVQDLEGMADHQKLSFLKDNIPTIRSAMENDPLPVERIREMPVTATMEKGHGYLFWHSEILDTLHDDDTLFMNIHHLSPAEQYFMDQTRLDVVAFFHQIFTLNPALAIQKFGAAPLFEKTMRDAMASLTKDADPHLYFSCYTDIDVADDAAAKLLDQRLADLTLAALQNMLLRDADALLFPHTKKSKPYLRYLPDGALREKFIAQNAALIDAAFDAAPHKGTDEYLKDRKIILTERVKICFHAAAMGDTTLLNEQMACFDTEGSDHVFIYSHYVGLPYIGNEHDKPVPEPFNPDPFTPQFELIRLTNPLAPADAIDKNCSAHSKYLWMMKRDGLILASTFTKAAMADYLAEQNKLGSITCPNVTDWTGFLFERAVPAI